MRSAKQARTLALFGVWGKATGGWEQGIMWLCFKIITADAVCKIDCCRRLTVGKSGKTIQSGEQQSGPEVGPEWYITSMVRSERVWAVLENRPTKIGRFEVSRFARASYRKREIRMTANFGENNLTDGLLLCVKWGKVGEQIRRETKHSILNMLTWDAYQVSKWTYK